MLTKLPLPAVIGVFLLTATIAVTSTTTTTATRTSKSTAIVKGIAANSATNTSSLGKVTTASEITRIGNENGKGNSKDVPTVTMIAKNKCATMNKAEVEDVRRTETTTSLLPLQPPLNLTSTTTSTFLTPSSTSRRRVKKHQLSISAPQLAHPQSQASNISTQATSTQPNSTQHSSLLHALQLSNVNVENGNVVKSDNYTTRQHGDTKKVLSKRAELVPALAAVTNKREAPKNSETASKESSAKSNDYIHFDIREDDESLRATANPMRGSRMETVNEVLSNLFPNGFTDIFRFSYASEEPNPANVAIQEERREESPKATTTTSTPVVETKITPAPGSTTTTTATTEKPRKSRGKTIFTVEKSVSKEYRRELAPGHTEIVVEKLEKLQRGANSGSGEFSDGSNVISKDDLLRINRAAVDSPVLPSLLMDPNEENATVSAERSKAIKQAPIIILNDDDSADMEGISAEDNLIAESQNVGQRVYQRLPAGDKPYGYKLGAQVGRGLPESEVSIRIVHDKSPPALGSMINQQPIFVSDEQQLGQEANREDKTAEATMRTAVVELPTKQLDTFQEHAEQSFHQMNLVQEAPSRKFLRNFNPVLSAGAGTSTPRGTFHYEANSLQPNFYGQAAELQAPKQNQNRGVASEKGENEVRSVGAEKAPKRSSDQNLRLPVKNYDKDAAQLHYFKEQQYLQQQQQLLQQQQQLLLQQQQQEQQRLLQERLIQQQQEQQRKEQTRQLQEQHQQQQLQLQQQHHQQQQQQQQQHQQEQHKQKEEQHEQQQQQQQKQQEQQRQDQEKQKQHQQHQQQQHFFQAVPNYQEPQHQQQQQLQQFHIELQQQQQQPSLQQEYALFQEHPPPHEYKQAQQHQHKQRQLQEEQAQREKQQQAEQENRIVQQQIIQQQQQQQKPQPTTDSEPASASLNHRTYNYPFESAPPQHRAPATPTPHSVVFVTLHTPTSQSTRARESSPAIAQKSPYEYVTKAAGTVGPPASTAPQDPSAPPTPAAIVKRPQGGYTFVEVQKSVNIHNKLITEKDGKLVEEHETIYPMPHYTPQYQKVVKVEPPLRPSQTRPVQQSHQQQYYPPQPQPPKPQAPQQQPPQQQQQASQGPKPAAIQLASQASVPQTHYPTQYAQQLSVTEGGVNPRDYYFVPNEYLSLSSNPINVQHIDEPEQQEEASSYAHLDQVLPMQAHFEAQNQAEAHVVHEQQHPHEYVQYIHHYAQQPVEQQRSQHEQQQKSPQHPPVQPEKVSAQASEHIVQQASFSAPHELHPQPAAENEIAQHHVEKIVERPVHIPYPVHVPQYIDRPYPVQEIVETHVPVPYPVPEPVPVPVHVDRYIDRPYPVEKIVEKRVPYPVEKVVEKIVEKEIPIEVEKVVEKVVDHPVPVPIRVPVGIPVPYAHQPTHEYDEHAQFFGSPFHTHPNGLGWSDSSIGPSDFGGRLPLSPQIPPKVLQNYYARMLKKLLPQALAQRGTSPPPSSSASPTYTHTQARPKPPTPTPPKTVKSTKPQKAVTLSSSTTPKQYSFKIGDMRFDLKPPPPPPTGPEWSKGSRYIYNTLPRDLSVADTSDSEHLADVYSGPFAAPDEPYDEFQRWRNGHSLKRSPQFGRNLQMEYGFKPPLVPSVEINDQGIPLNADAKKDE